MNTSKNKTWRRLRRNEKIRAGDEMTATINDWQTNLQAASGGSGGWLTIGVGDWFVDKFVNTAPNLILRRRLSIKVTTTTT